MDEPVRIALIQMAMGDDRQANFDKAASFAEAARARDARIIALPELFATPYFCREEDRANLALAEPIPGPTTDYLGKLAARSNAVVIGSVFEYVDTGLGFNTALVFERDGRLLGRSRKTHIPQYPHYQEKFYFAPGDSDYPVFHTSAGRIAVPTCWDQWFPEVARIAYLKGAEVVVYPTAIGYTSLLDDDYRAAWRAVVCGHAVANALYVAAVNRTGTEADLHFWGSSFVADPFGRVVAEADAEEGLVLADLSPERIAQMRSLNHYLRDRRPDTYGSLLKRWASAE